ncbi:hypothetical protein [Kitasatospora sp. Ki12]
MSENARPRVTAFVSTVPSGVAVCLVPLAAAEPNSGGCIGWD